MGGVHEAFAVPMSFAQERMWFLDRLDSGRATYNIPMTVEIQGRVDVDVVAAALADLVMRHEILRTTFRVLGDQPVQVVSPEPDIRLSSIDLGHLAIHERRAEALRLAQQAALMPFDLARGPLLRSTLVRLSPREHVLLLTVHHIIADLWSSAVLLRDLNALLDARRRGISAGLPELAIQYADFAEWQRRELTGRTLERLVDYWTRQLANAPSEVTFPHDHPRPPTQSSHGATLHFTVAGDITQRLTQLGREEGATLFMTLLAAFKLLLGRYAGTDDVSVGTPIANRRRHEVENLIGFFSNTLVLRTSLDGDPTFRELIRRVSAVTLGAYDHQDMPFEQLVAILGTERNLSHGPLFQVMFGLNTTTQSDHSAQSGVSEWARITTDTAKFDATVLLRESQTGLEGGFEYCTDLYEAETVEVLLDQYLACLAAVTRDPDRPLSEITREVFGATRERVRALSSGPTADVPLSSPVEQFAAEVRRAPAAIAVVAGSAALSYEQLDGLSNRVGRLIRSLGVAAGAHVGICMRPGLEMAAAVLGVLKIGAAYVPLDPAYPAERLAYMSQDAGVTLILTGEDTATLVPGEVAPEVVIRSGAPSLEHSEDDLGHRVRADDIAYVIYTSGSTGRPKGVALPHGALANLVAWQAATSPPAPRTLQLAPLSFDVSFQEMFSTWCAGGTLVLCGEHLRGDVSALLTLAREQRAERMFLPPAMLQLMADVAGGDDWPSSLREIVTAGEALRITPAVRTVLRGLDGLVLRNQYGPSETHVVTEYRVAAGDPDLGDLPPIGRPIPNVTVHVLDDALDPVPLGARGELYLGGPALAHGYLHRGRLTAERFVPDPFAEEPGRRLYRTGDLVRFRPDGMLQFLGRADDQLKVRGFRVEPGEVEAALEQVGGVRASAVVGHIGPDDVLGLVAYVEAESGTSQAAVDLRQLLRPRLPKWMVPERVVFVDRLPLTPSGKVDRGALARQALPPLDGAGSSVPARTDLEATLCALWSEVLGVGAIGVRDSFFDLGGHSLAVARVAARVRERMGVEVPLRVFFEATNVEDLACEIVVQRALASEPATVEALLHELREQPSPGLVASR